ncbi:MAG: Na/Pi symporter [Cyclobacteriaceae bacterium]
MLKKVFLPLLLILLAYVLVNNPDFKQIAAGISVLLFGMIALENGFKAFAEGPLKNLLKRVTNKFYKSMGLGIAATAVLQSSSLISVITISFISAGLLDLTGGIGVIFGANIGTTATAWMVAVFGLKIQISEFAMPMLVIGIILVFQNKQSYKGLGNILAGLGFFFLGIHFMKEGFDAFEGSIALDQYALSGFVGLVVYVFLGLVATVILQSSSASMAIILTALAASHITYFNALALAIGANVGTTITAIIGAAASNTAGRRVAGAHLVFNVVTGFLALVFLVPLSWLVDIVSSTVNIASNDYTLKLAAFHTLFNTLGVLVMYPFVSPLERMLVKRIKDKVDKDIAKPKFISDAALMYPQAAIGALIKETQHLFDNTFELISHSLSLHRSDIQSDKKLEEVLKGPGYKGKINIDEVYFQKVKTIYSAIIEFATLAQQVPLSANEVRLIYHIKEANRHFVEVIKDLKDLQPNMQKYLESDNEAMRVEYDHFRKRISKIVREILRTQDFHSAMDLPKKEVKSAFQAHIQIHAEKFRKEKSKLKAHEKQFNQKLDELIRERKISNMMASSLMNDSATVASISKNLIKAGELLYIQTDILLFDSLQEIAVETESLDDSEVKISDRSHSKGDKN